MMTKVSGYQISETSRGNFYITPNLIDDLKLSPIAHRLYGHIKRVAGDTGVCWQSLDTLCEICCMSRPTLIKAKNELKKRGLISIEEVPAKIGVMHKITITDIWLENAKYYEKGSKESRAKLV